MKYRFKPTEGFWESFYGLTSRRKDSTRRAWKIFKQNPFDPRLRPHKIHKLSPHTCFTVPQYTSNRFARYNFTALVRTLVSSF